MLGSIYAMVAVALTLSIVILRFLNFSIPGLFMIGAMAVWALLRNEFQRSIIIHAGRISGEPYLFG